MTPDLPSGRVLRSAPRPGPTGHGLRRACHAFVAAALGAAGFAWLTPADAPRRAFTTAEISYDTMAAGLRRLYPAAGPKAADLVRTVHEEADRHRLDACIVMGVIARESSFRHDARNRRDLGLMQVNQDWHRDLVASAGGAKGMLEPQRNVRAGIAVLARYRTQSRSDLEALERYNGLGKRNGYAQRVLVEAQRLQAAGACMADEAFAAG
jgi:soluble lytic murein transglycosylase-like protein